MNKKPELQIDKYLNVAQRRLDNAISEHEIPFVWVAYSGGSDSAVIVELMRRLRVPVSWGVMTIDTGLSSIGHIERIRSDIDRANLELAIFTGEGLSWYVDNVRHYGFAYTPNQHTIYYRSLKERAIDESIRSVKTKYHQRILSVTGVRRAESHKRSKTPILYHKRGARVTLNLIADYNDADKRVILSNADWYHGKSTEDCMCNWHCGYKRTENLNSAARVAVSVVSDELKSCGAWGYGEKPTRDQVSMFSDVRSNIGDMPEDSFCINCLSKVGVEMNEKPEMQVVIIHGGAKCYWLTPDDTRIGSDQRYLHPDCRIYFKGSRSHRTDYAVSLALQDAKMSVMALRYHKK